MEKWSFRLCLDASSLSRQPAQFADRLDPAGPPLPSAPHSTLSFSPTSPGSGFSPSLSPVQSKRRFSGRPAPRDPSCFSLPHPGPRAPEETAALRGQTWLLPEAAAPGLGPFLPPVTFLSPITSGDARALGSCPGLSHQYPHRHPIIPSFSGTMWKSWPEVHHHGPRWEDISVGFT